MLGLNVFVVGTSDKSKQWVDIVQLANFLDKNNFLPKGYFVDEEKYSRKPVVSSTFLSSRRKCKLFVNLSQSVCGSSTLLFQPMEM